MQRTNIYLDERQLRSLDRLATEEGLSRAELIRRVLDRWMAGTDRDVTSDLDSIDASFGALGDLEVLEREPGERARHLERVWRLGA